VRGSAAPRVRGGSASTARRRRWVGTRRRRIARMVRDVKPATQPRDRRRTRSCTLLVAAFGDPGHAFPAIALARALQARGHRVVVETWERWREAVESLDLEFTAAEEYDTFPPPPAGSNGARSAADAALALAPLIDDLRPDVVVSDILTLAPALAAECAGAPRATLIPHVYPVHEPGLPFFAFGALPPRTAVGRRLWRAALPALLGGLRRGRRELNESRAAVGLEPVSRMHGGISEELALVATFPQLEYPRSWPANVHVTGPMEFELPYEEVELPAGRDPLIVVAPSTAQDPDCRLVRGVLEALADEPVRVLATTNRHRSPDSLRPAPANARVVEWVGYSQVMPAADLVVCHGGHGTLARALSAGAPVLTCPAVGDMTENGARVAWSGTGLMLPWRMVRPATLGTPGCRILSSPKFPARARSLAGWASERDGAMRGAELVEQLAIAARR
jgi:UDP:flavonoid glycosyltransferase YjiC (YdhE family)